MPFINKLYIAPNCYVFKRLTPRKRRAAARPGRRGDNQDLFELEHDRSLEVPMSPELRIRGNSRLDLECDVSSPKREISYSFLKENCEECRRNSLLSKDSEVLWCPRHTWVEDVTYSIPQRTDALLMGLDLILEHHGASREIRRKMNDQVHSYLDICPNEKIWLSCAKHMLAYPLAKYLNNELPVSPERVFEPSGLFRRWWKKRLSSFNRKNTHLWYSWYQAKRSSLPVSMEFVEDTYSDHFKTLTKEDPGHESTIDKIFKDRTFLALLERLRNKITKKMKKSDFRKESASNSACFEQTRSSGGQQTKLRKVTGLYANLGQFSELVSMSWCPRTFGRSIRTNVVTESREDYGRFEWQGLENSAADELFDRPINCTIQAVLEPMKVRVISKGEALPYYMMKPLQKAMHRSMRKIDCFRLIGRPFSPTDVIDLKKEAISGDEWFSIDYSAATDGLSWKYSGRILKFLISDLEPHIQEAALSVLGPHDLNYPRPTGDVDYWGTQKNGQLMGSILSFPILCLANLGVYLLANKERQAFWSDKRRLQHVLVNGDDMLYCAQPPTWDRHIKIGERVGLKMSVGKAYHHRIYANINSTSIHCDLLNEESSPWKIDFLNCGLFFGQHKVQSRALLRDGESDSSCEPMDDDTICRIASEERVNAMFAKAHMSADPSKGLVPNINVVLQGSLPGKQHSLMSAFLRTHKGKLRRECTLIERRGGKTSLRTQNLFLPIACGGVGVIPPLNFRFKVTKFDRELAYYNLTRISLPVTGQHPLPGYEPVPIDVGSNSPWFKRTTVLEIPGVRLGERTMLKPSICRTGFVHYSDNSRSYY